MLILPIFFINGIIGVSLLVILFVITLITLLIIMIGKRKEMKKTIRNTLYIMNGIGLASFIYFGYRL